MVLAKNMSSKWPTMTILLVLGKAVSCMHPPLQKNGPWTWNTYLPRHKEPIQPVPGLWSWVEISFPVLSSTHAPLFCVCALWHLVNPTAVSALSGEGMGSFCRVMRGVPTCKLPGIRCQERLPSHGKSKPAIEASCVSEALFYPCCAFLGDSDTSIQWTDICVWSPPLGLIIGYTLFCSTLILR